MQKYGVKKKLLLWKLKFCMRKEFIIYTPFQHLHFFNLYIVATKWCSILCVLWQHTGGPFSLVFPPHGFHLWFNYHTVVISLHHCTKDAFLLTCMAHSAIWLQTKVPPRECFSSIPVQPVVFWGDDLWHVSICSCCRSVLNAVMYCVVVYWVCCHAHCFRLIFLIHWNNFHTDQPTECNLHIYIYIIYLHIPSLMIHNN